MFGGVFLYSSLFLELKDKGNLKYLQYLQFLPESLGSLLEY